MLKVVGTPSETGDTYTIAVTAKRRRVRNAVMRLLLIGNKREILSRFESYGNTAHVVLKLEC